MKEFAIRFERFGHWNRLINDHNNTNGANYNLGHNQFSDWTDAEYKAILNFVIPKTDEDHQSKNKVIDFDVSIWPFGPPKHFNWVEKGGVTPVKDQERCGACWAFASIGAIEGAHFAKTRELLSLSEQQLIDCDIHKDTVDHINKGCHGGDYVGAFRYFKSGAFPMLESVYPYASGSGDSSTDCLYSASQATKIKVKEALYIEGGL